MWMGMGIAGNQPSTKDTLKNLVLVQMIKGRERSWSVQPRALFAFSDFQIFAFSIFDK